MSINLGSTEESLSKDRSEYQQIIEMIQNPESQSAEEGFRKLTQMFVDAGRSDVDSKILIQKFNDFNKDEVICDYRPLSLKKISKLMIRSL